MAKKTRKNKQPAQQMETIGQRRNVPIGILSAIGVLLTSALLVMHTTQSGLPYCDAGSGCDVVQNSRWSELFGIPIAVWGWLTYATLALSAFWLYRRSTRAKVIVLVATVAMGVSIYLNAISYFAIKAICIYCLLSFALVTAIYALSWKLPRDDVKGWRLGSTLSAGFVIGLMSLAYAGVFDPSAGPEDPYLKGLAEHLQSIDAKFYGAFWCPHCQQQKLAFGSSAQRLPYVECSPNGQRGSRSTECLAADIKNYPTWVINGQRFERTLSAGQLARYSGFREPEGSNTD